MIRLPPVLRPRLTWRYVLCASAALYVTYCFLVDSPLLASRLPQYTGPYPVGAIDIESPCDNRQTSAFKLKETDQPAFQLETVLFTLYYPATAQAVRSKPRHYWIPKPVSITGEGYLRFGGVNNFILNNVVTGALWGLVGGITIPAKVGVPLTETTISLETQDDYNIQMLPEKHEGLPVMIFSHGFASSRTDYTHYLGELASRGYVVAAIEHRDGSGPGSLVMKEGLQRVAFPIKQSHIAPHPDLNTASFKAAQLSFRQAEVEETIRVLRAINSGSGQEIYLSNSRHEGQSLSHWHNRLNLNAITMAGHSFGATLALQTLQPGPNSLSLPLHGCIALDPGKSSGPLNTDIAVPLLVIHSNSWSATHSLFYGRPHFSAVKDLVSNVTASTDKAGWFMTSLGTSHTSVTDAPLIEPLLLSWTTGATIDVKEGVREYVRASAEFLRFQHFGAMTGLLAQPVSHEEYMVPKGAKGKSVLEKEYRKYWEVHVAPETGA